MRLLSCIDEINPASETRTFDSALGREPSKFPPRLFVWTLHGAVLASIRRTSEARLTTLKKRDQGP